MNFTRRQFLAQSAGVSFLGLTSPNRLLAQALEKKSFPRVARGKNLFIAFNNIRDPEDGESDEFTTIANIHRVLDEMKVDEGATVIGIGARTGIPGDVYGRPGEMGYLWKKGSPWRASVTDPVDARPIPLEKDDPIPVTQVGVLHESTAHHLTLDHPELAGSVLWTFYEDETRQSDLIDVGMHNVFSDLDGGMIETVYEISRRARAGKSWASEKARGKLSKFMPSLSDDRIWRNFSASLGKPFVQSRWLDYIRKQGWQGAAVVLRGSMMNVAQFHLREWNRKSPQEPKGEVGKGTHTFLNLKLGRECRPFLTPAEGEWTMVGFIWDLERKDATPAMEDTMRFCDIFGQHFHIHGFKDDGSIGGHTLFSMLGEGKLNVSLYPLQFDGGQTAFLFNNDLRFVPESIRQTAHGLKVRVKNDGQNFVRNVGVRLSASNAIFTDKRETLLIPRMGPGEEIEVCFSGPAGMATTGLTSDGSRELWLDRDGHFFEGGPAKANNRIRFKA